MLVVGKARVSAAPDKTNSVSYVLVYNNDLPESYLPDGGRLALDCTKFILNPPRTGRVPRRNPSLGARRGPHCPLLGSSHYIYIFIYVNGLKMSTGAPSDQECDELHPERWVHHRVAERVILQAEFLLVPFFICEDGVRMA